MIDEKLIEVINGLKNKRLSDTEITEILLENEYTIEDVKENLHHYNQTHGYLDKNYIKEYEKITGKPLVEDKKEIESEKKIDNNTKISKKRNLLKKVIMGIIIITMVLLIIYIVITFNVFDIVKDFFYNLSF
jgi:hypothetical protein